MQDYGSVGLKNWDNKPVYIIGGGPSLKPFIKNLKTLYQKGYIIAVNNTWKYCFFPDAIVSLDHRWISDNLPLVPSMSGPVFAAVDGGNPRIACESLTYLRRPLRTGIYKLSEDPTAITNGMNSGYAALNFAYLKGAKTIYLLGFDFKATPEATHFHPSASSYDPKDGTKYDMSNSIQLFKLWADAFKDTVEQLKKEHVEVFNCSPDSLLTSFSYKPYQEVI